MRVKNSIPIFGNGIGSGKFHSRLSGRELEADMPGPILPVLLILLSKISKNGKIGRLSVIPVGTTLIVIVGHFFGDPVSTSFVGLGPKLGVLYIGN